MIGAANSAFAECQEIGVRIRKLYVELRAVREAFERASKPSQVSQSRRLPELDARSSALLAEIRDLEAQRDVLADRRDNAGRLAKASREFARSIGQLPAELEVR